MKFMKLGSKPDCFQSEGNNLRYVASEMASDLVVFIGDLKFYLHKFPLLSKSAHLQKLVGSSNEGHGDEVHIHDIPGGHTAFELCAKFCYGVTVTLNPYNVVAARCAAEYLEMNEHVEKGNLIYKIDAFLNSSILKSWKDSIVVLKATNSHLPMSEELKLVGRCVEAIASRASTDASKVDWSYTYNRKKIPQENGVDHNLHSARSWVVPKDWWVDDLSELEVDIYERVITNIKNKGVVSDEVIGEALKSYASRWLQGFENNDTLKWLSILDKIVWLLPAKKGSVSCSFLLKLLKLSISLDSGEPTKRELVKRIGHQLEEASVNDLLIRASNGDTGMYDVHVVQQILKEFMLETRNEISEASKVMVAKLIDGYLAGIAEDPNLPLTSFVALAEMVSSFPRPSHDGLYRAIDMYLKIHPGISKGERKRICRLMDCKNLSVDACKHAVQNERLPMRVVVQVLFFEQVRANASPDLPKTIKDLNSTSCGSSRSMTTNTEDEEWDADGLKALRANGDTKSNVDKAAITKMRGLLMSKRIFSKMWSSKGGQEEKSGSDSSDSLVSTNIEEAKSSTLRMCRHSVS